MGGQPPRLVAGLALILAFALSAAEAYGWEVSIDAPPSLGPSVARIRRLDPATLEEALGRAGLALPTTVQVTLIPETDPRAGEVPDWIVGLALGAQDVVIFPERVASYPYDSLESVMRHEVVHLALSAAAAGHQLPRWFHEGVAVSVEAGWTFGDDLRLLLAAATRPGIADLNLLFQADSQPQTAEAYRLAAVLVEDVRRRHGGTAPGAIAVRVAAGMPFSRAFAIETGETADAAAARAWPSYRRWMTWVSFVTSGTALWTVILGLAFLAFFARRAQQARRRQWGGDEDDWEDL
jgi:hypothetical protein